MLSVRALLLVFALVGPAATLQLAAQAIVRGSLPRTTTPQLCAPSPEDWREFRQRLVSGGIKVTGEEDGGEVAGEDAQGSSEPPAAVSERTAVAPANEDLLKSQNEALWKEYLEGAWAHESPCPEPGGLVCRLSLQAQLTRQMRANGGDSSWPEKLRERLLSELPTEDAESASADLLEQWSSNTMYMHRLAESMVADCLQQVASKASDGRVQWGAINEEQRELVRLYSEAQDAWQEVALVLKTGSGREGDDNSSAEGATVATESVVINRPIAKSMSHALAELLLNGDGDGRDGPPLFDETYIQKFLRAFGAQAAVYVGGPDAQGAAGLCVHGFDLPGASEVAPGTRIYVGGVNAIVDAVLEGRMSPLDVRWFVGRRLSVSTADGKWAPIACSRPLALKQCLGLPKPLWHEVLETAGGEVADISRIELLKRTDLEQE